MIHGKVCIECGEPATNVAQDHERKRYRVGSGWVYKNVGEPRYGCQAHKQHAIETEVKSADPVAAFPATPTPAELL